MTEKEKMLAGEIYAAGDKELVKMRKATRLLTEKFNRTSIVQLKKERSC